MINTPERIAEAIERGLNREKPCPSKVCRMGEIECADYWSCRDTCRIENKRITAMDKCPKG